MSKIQLTLFLSFVIFFSQSYAADPPQVVKRERESRAYLVHTVDSTTNLIFNIPNNNIVLAASRRPPYIKNEIGRIGASSNLPGIRYKVLFISTNGVSTNPTRTPFLMNDNKKKVISYNVSYGGKIFTTPKDVLFEGSTGTKKPELLQIITLPYLIMLKQGVYIDTLTFQLTVE